MRTYVKICALVFTLLVINRCTENNIFDNKISISDNLTLTGTVDLSDHSSPANIYIWLEGLELTTYTDNEGSFQIELPPPASQPGNGLTGVYNIYYFLANYGIRSSSILLLNGQFEYGKGAIDNDGAINGPIVLQKLLDIKTSVSPSQIAVAYKDSIVTTISLVNLVDTVRVRTYKRITGATSCLIIKSIRVPKDEALLLRGDPTFYVEEIITQPTDWIMIYKFISGFFEPGKYEFIPFLQVVQEGIPPELLKSLGLNQYDLNYEYLNIPYLQETAILNVSDN